MENFDLKKYLAENKLLKEEKTFDVYNDGGEPVLVNLDKATPSQEKLIRWEMPEITDPETSEEAQEIANEIMQLNSAEDVKQYYGYKRGWFSSSLKDMVGDAMVAYNDLSENKLLKEEIKFINYVTVDQDEFKAQYDKYYDDYGNDEDFIEEYGRDFLSPNIEAINQYYGDRVHADDVITDFFEAGGINNISSNEEFEEWLDKNREFYI